MTAKQQALIDMSSEGISIKFLSEEKAILAFTATEDSIKIDFRVFNGGHNKGKKQSKKKYGDMVRDKLELEFI